MPDRHFRIGILLAILLIACIGYANTFDGGWVWDDVSSVLLHQHVQTPSAFFELFTEDQHAFGRGQGNFYRPLVAFSFMIDFLLSYDSALDARPNAGHPDIKPFVFHLTNLLWHVAAAFALFWLLLKLDAPRLVQAAVPLLYVAHPLHTEAVAYISGRADMMSAAGIYLGLCFALSEASGARRICAWAASGLCFAAALLSKESALIFPVLLALLIFLRPFSDAGRGDRQRAYLARLAPLALAGALTGVYAALRMTALHFGEASTAAAAPFLERLQDALQSLALYVKLLFAPAGLHMERTLDGAPGWTAWAGAALLLTFLAAFAWALRAKQHRIAIAVAWFIASWLPISGLVPLNAPLAEHWMYVPMAGFWWFAAELLHLGAKSPAARKAGLAAIYALALFFVALTVQRNQDWHSNETIFTATLQENPRTARVHYNFAVDNEVWVENLPGARRHFETVLAFYQETKAPHPETGGTNYVLQQEIDIYRSLGRIYYQLGEYPKAMGNFQPLLSLEQPFYMPQVRDACLGMGRCLLALGDPIGAAAYFQQAVTLDPNVQAMAEALLKNAPLGSHS